MQLWLEIVHIACTPHGFNLSPAHKRELLEGRGAPYQQNPLLLSSQVASIQGKMFGLLGTSVRACDLAVLSRREAGKLALKL